MVLAHVIVPARDLAKATAALSGVANVTIDALDLGVPATIDAFATRFGEGPLHLLINNAGIMAAPLSRDGRGLESQLAVNHVGHFRLFARLLPAVHYTPDPTMPGLTADDERRLAALPKEASDALTPVLGEPAAKWTMAKADAVGKAVDLTGVRFTVVPTRWRGPVTVMAVITRPRGAWRKKGKRMRGRGHPEAGRSCRSCSTTSSRNRCTVASAMRWPAAASIALPTTPSGGL